MKYLLLFFAMMFAAGGAGERKEEVVHVARFDIYASDGILYPKVYYDERFFSGGKEVHYRIFELFILEQDRDKLHEYVDKVKDIQDSITLDKIQKIQKDQRQKI